MPQLIFSFIALLVLALMYIGVARPYFERKGWVRQLPTFVSGFRERFCVHIRHSLTVAWAWLIQIGGASIELAMLMDKNQVSETLSAIGLGEWTGLALLIIGWVTLLARMRTARA